MNVETYGFSIEAENEDPETCYGSRVRAISSVGRAPARQRIQTSFVGSCLVAPSGTKAALLSDESADSSHSRQRRFALDFAKHVAWKLHRVVRQTDPQLSRLVVIPIIAVVLVVAVFGSSAEARSSRSLPPAWRTWLEVCSREQPKPGRFDVTKWSTPNWTNTRNWSYPGGCGMTRENYADIRLAAWPLTMDKATPRQQLWACHRLFWKYARIGQQLHGGDYAAGQRYGATVWDVHTQMGWHGFKKDGKTWQ